MYVNIYIYNFMQNVHVYMYVYTYIVICTYIRIDILCSSEPRSLLRSDLQRLAGN